MINIKGVFDAMEKQMDTIAETIIIDPFTDLPEPELSFVQTVIQTSGLAKFNWVANTTTRLYNKRHTSNWNRIKYAIWCFGVFLVAALISAIVVTVKLVRNTIANIRETLRVRYPQYQTIPDPDVEAIVRAANV